MTWVPLLLADRSPILRRLVLKDLLHRPDNDGEVLELEKLTETDPLVMGLLGNQAKDGSWRSVDVEGTMSKDRVRATSFALQRLGYFGVPEDHSAILQGVNFIFSKQRKDGSWPIPKDYDAQSEDSGFYTMMPLQTSIPLLGIAASGHAQDERAELAYDWLLDKRLEDGSWPTGKIGKVYGYRAGYRRMPHSERGCRTNSTLALQCLSMHPGHRGSEATKRALELLLARETRDRRNLGFNVARIIGVEPHRGNFTYH
ncbi:MAG: prenyltransferase/squalene oxidase repeat-containing protein, partial [Candidatus Hermodarchaeota archaeon]